MTTTRTYILFILFTLLCPAFLRAGDKKAVAAGSFHALVLKQDGTLWSFGRNFSGALGVGGDVDSSPEPIKIMDDVVQISAQNETSMAVKADGSLWAWGQNDKGQFGNGSTSYTGVRQPVKIMDNVRLARAGRYQSFAIDRDGNLWAWGDNGFGQLGDGTTTQRLSPVKVMSGVKDVSGGQSSALVVAQDGSLYELGPGIKQPRKIMDGVLKACCPGFYMVLRDDGTVWTWGWNNDDGQLGTGDTEKRRFVEDARQILSDVSDISAAGCSGMAVRNDGTLWAWGQNNWGQLGDGTTTNRLAPVKVDDNVLSVSCGNLISVWITRDGNLRVVGKPLREE